MRLTDVRIMLAEKPAIPSAAPIVLCFVEATFDEIFLVRDLKLVQSRDRIFVAMPSRPTTIKCLNCSQRIQLRSGKCNKCGTILEMPKEARFYSDIVYFLDDEKGSEAWHIFNNRVVQEYQRVLVRSMERIDDRLPR